MKEILETGTVVSTKNEMYEVIGHKLTYKVKRLTVNEKGCLEKVGEPCVLTEKELEMDIKTVPTTPPIVRLYELAKEMVDTAIIVPPTAEYPNDIPEEVFTMVSGTLNFLLPYYRARRG